MSFKIKLINSPLNELNEATCESDYGSRKFYNPITKKYDTNTHNGVDLVEGDEIVSVADGTVVATQNNIEGYTENYPLGNFVRINHGEGIETVYAHMRTSSVCVRVGQKIKKGTILGRKGSTGYSTSPHLHFAVKINGNWTDPKPYLTGEKELPGVNQTPASSTDDDFKVGDRVVVSGRATGDSYGGGNQTAEYGGNVNDLSDIRYITSINNDAPRPYHISVGNTLGNGDRGWVTKEQIKKI